MGKLNLNIDDEASKPQIASNGKMMGGNTKQPSIPASPPTPTQQAPLGTSSPQSSDQQINQQQATQQQLNQQGVRQQQTTQQQTTQQQTTQQQAAQQQARQPQTAQQQSIPMPKPTTVKSNKEENKNKKKSKRKKKNKNIDEPVVMDEEYVKKAYRAYRSRRVMVFAALLIGVVGILGFAAYNVFKPTLSITDAERGAMYAVDKSQRNWDSGVQSFLQRNLHTILSEKFQSTSTVKKFSVDNISVERNIIVASGSNEEYSPVSNFFICYFSADLTANDNTVRTYFELPISIDSQNGEGFKQAGEITFSTRKPYSDNEPSSKEIHSTLKFQDDKEDTKIAAELKPTLTNFFTLAYNDERHSTGDYYKSTTSPLKFNGKFMGIDTCKYYTQPNSLGYNTLVEYKLELSNGLSFETTTYLKVEKSGDNYVVKEIL